ncbi:MAG: DNA repair protein RecN [Brevibacterium yomogidense]|uniref:DNA repair protein RecN n=1 Tax=Brevibacterium yomogidense TaxID=946573 RepID=A0A1X6XFS0_9MICO|nr:MULTISPECIES: DNA repair protein RecN [Brevibacterium]SLM97919.1 DNA repair protein RecN [Brevibacterium yomogidense]SMX68317.1 DNA repair protein RecN (Recombination protein N) [Brevibacterium sp. Mu109]
MISSIGIENLGVITSAHIDLGAGLTAVTGETGAGKTMFVTALDLLTGARADASTVRRDADRAVVEGVFALPQDGGTAAERIVEAGGDADDEAVLTRILPREGRARATAGGRTVPAGVLRDVGQELVSMHGQSEQLTLRAQAQQRELLDALTGEDGAAARAEYAEAFAEHRRLSDEQRRLESTRSERAARMDFLRNALETIDGVRPTEGEDEELAALAARLGAAEELQQAAGRAHDLIMGSDWDDAESATALVAQASESLARAAAVDGSLTDAARSLEDVSVRMADAGADLSSYLAGFGDDEAMSLEDAEARRAEISSLNAYGEDLAAVLAFEEQAGGELLDLENSEASLGDMDATVAAAQARLDEAAVALRAVRIRAAEEFSTSVGGELAALAMPHASLSFAVTETTPAAHGADDVRLLFSSHAAAAPADIGKTASGGELSRVMLAIEVVRARTERFPTFVFDEVDAGVGGAAAVEIGRRLARLASGSQVIVVTHLPQVAAWADHHLVVRKTDEGTGAVSGVRELGGEDRTEELARMLAGVSGSASARAHAEELLSDAESEKARFRAELMG